MSSSLLAELLADAVTPSPHVPFLRIVQQVMDIRELVPPGVDGPLQFIGTLRTDARNAYAYIGPRFRELGFTARMQHHKQGVVVLAMPGVINPEPPQPHVALMLFLATIFTTGFSGFIQALVQGEHLAPALLIGLAYSASLLGILMAHEMGHFLVAKRFGVVTSYPYFIPMPLTPLGTMGAVISMKEPVRDRAMLLKIGIAGPIAGLVVAIPILLIGLFLSKVQPLSEIKAALTDSLGWTIEGDSALFLALKWLVFGRWLPSTGNEIVAVHPIAFAGWAGILVTSLNLLPAGQLDGGHIFSSLFGVRAGRMMSMVVAALLIPLGFLWEGWFIWAILIVLLARRPAPVLNEVVELTPRERALAILGIVLFILTFTPVPLSIVSR